MQGIYRVAAILKGLYSLQVSNIIERDGNCMFRAMSFHLFGKQTRHLTVRTNAIAWLKANMDILHAFAAQGDGHFSADQYLDRMAKPGEWGDEIMLMAITQAYQVSIMVNSGYDDATGDFIATVYPHDASGPHCGLMFLANSQHYEIVFP